MIDPKTYVPQRFSPLFAILIDEEVNNIMKPSNLSFLELFGALAKKEFIRVVPIEDVKQCNFDSFFMKIQQKTTAYSKSFTSPEFEENGTTDPLFSPFSGTITTTLRHPSKESMNPPWFQYLFTLLYKYEQFSNFNFCDQPLCVLYVSAAGKASMSENVIRSSLVFPEWMKEFVENIPIFNIVVYDGLSQENFQKVNNLGFLDIFYLPFRSRQEGAPGGVDPVDLRNLFNSDNSILNREKIGEFMTEKDLKNFKQVILEISQRVHTTLNLLMQQLEAENNNNKQFKNKVNRFFHKNKTADKTTQFLNIPFRKIIRLQLGCYYLISQRYKEARKMLKQFLKSIKDLHPEIKIYTLFLRGMSAQQIPDHDRKFREDINDVLNSNIQTTNLIFGIYVPIIIGEMRFKQANYTVATNLYKEVTKKFLHKVPIQYKQLLSAIVDERLAGIYMSENHLRSSLFYTSVAASNYLDCEQVSHGLRCLICLIQNLPRDTWQYLYQNSILLKAEILISLSQPQRSLIDYQTLLSLPDLSQLLQRKVITEIWAPFNDPKSSGTIVHLNSLLKVKKLSLVDNSQPEYWNLKKSMLVDVLDAFYRFMKRSQKVKITMDEWFEKKDEMKQQNQEPKTVSVCNPIYISIDLYNRFVFAINLSKVNFVIEYEGVESDQDETENYSIQYLGKIEDIKGMSTNRLTFKFIPKTEGNFKICKFVKNYWGSAETEVECGPLVFSSTKDKPLLSISFQNFHDVFPAYGVMRFNVVIKNTSNYNSIDDFYLAFDNNDKIISETETHEKEGKISFLHIKQQLLPGQTVTVPLLFRAISPTIINVRFLAAFNENSIAAYAIKKVQIISMVDVNARIINKRNDIGNYTVYCSIKGSINGISVLGVINRNTKYIRSIYSQSIKNKTINTGQSCSIVSFTSEETENNAESWRSSYFSNDKNESLALIFQFPETRIPAQAPIRFVQEKIDTRLKIELPPIAKASLKLKFKCKVWLVDPPPQKNLIDNNDKDFELFIKPLKIVHGETENNDDSDTAQFAGCRWIGLTKTKLCRSNNFTAEFYFVACRIGIFHVSGFVVSEDPNFVKRKEIKMMQSFRVDQA